MKKIHVYILLTAAALCALLACSGSSSSPTGPGDDYFYGNDDDDLYGTSSMIRVVNNSSYNISEVSWAETQDPVSFWGLFYSSGMDYLGPGEEISEYLPAGTGYLFLSRPDAETGHWNDYRLVDPVTIPSDGTAAVTITDGTLVIVTYMNTGN